MKEYDIEILKKFEKMGIIKQKYDNKIKLTIMQRIGIYSIMILIFALTMFILVNESKDERAQHKKELIQQKEFIEQQDTLIVSVDLRYQTNITEYINKNYPNRKISSYKHIDSDYSAWDGVHNFYEFILIKK